ERERLELLDRRQGERVADVHGPPRGLGRAGPADLEARRRTRLRPRNLYRLRRTLRLPARLIDERCPRILRAHPPAVGQLCAEAKPKTHRAALDEDLGVLEAGGQRGCFVAGVLVGFVTRLPERDRFVVERFAAEERGVERGG